MSIVFPLVKFGSGGTAVYATDNNASNGTRYICEIEGLEAFALADNIGTQKALDGTIYSQIQAVKDQLVVVTFPLIDYSKFDAIRDLVNTASSGLTTYPLDITVTNGDSFTFTAKPAGITFDLSIISGMVANVAISQFCTD